MRILLICNYKKDLGGISVQVDLLYKYLNLENKVRADIFSFNYGIFKRILYFFKLIFIAQKYDILHIHGCSNWGFLPIIFGVIVGKLLSKRIIITYHGGGADAFFAKHPRITRTFLNKADSVIVLSGFLKSIFDKYKIKNITIPNIVEFKENQYFKRHLISPNFISIRSLREIYNIKCLLKAFKIIKTKFDNATLVILGDGPCRQDLEKYVKENKISDVSFVGFVSNLEVYRYLKSADIFLSASTVDNMPVSILEAFNAGLLVISSNVGGVPYILENDITGYLFESNNEYELAEKMRMACIEQEKTLSIIKNAKLEVNKYSWTLIRNKLFTCYSII